MLWATKYSHLSFSCSSNSLSVTSWYSLVTLSDLQLGLSFVLLWLENNFVTFYSNRHISWFSIFTFDVPLRRAIFYTNYLYLYSLLFDIVKSMLKSNSNLYFLAVLRTLDLQIGSLQTLNTLLFQLHFRRMIIYLSSL